MTDIKKTIKDRLMEKLTEARIDVEAYGAPKFKNGKLVFLEGDTKSFQELVDTWSPTNPVVTLDGEGSLGKEANTLISINGKKVSYDNNAAGIRKLNKFIEEFKKKNY
jgi:hypothetical protein